MFELTQVAENSYYIQSPAKIGLVRLNETDVCLIDSGSDKDAGRRTRQLLDANGWHLTAIYNTHSNADHIGGNSYLQKQTGCKIYAPGIECSFTRHPVLEPSFLYGGFPPKALRHKFLLAQESEAEPLTPGCLPDGFEILPLPGHFFDMGGLFPVQADLGIALAMGDARHAEVHADLAALAGEIRLQLLQDVSLIFGGNTVIVADGGLVDAELMLGSQLDLALHFFEHVALGMADRALRGGIFAFVDVTANLANELFHVISLHIYH